MISYQMPPCMSIQSKVQDGEPLAVDWSLSVITLVINLDPSETMNHWGKDRT